MKTKIFITATIILALFFSTSILAQKVDKKLEKKLKKLEQKLQDKENQLHSIEIPEMHLDLSGLEESMGHLEYSLSNLEHIEIPDIHVEIPEIPEIDMDFSNFNFDYDVNFGEFHHDYWDNSDLFDNLSEDEEIKVSAIRSMGKQGSEKAVPALKKIIKKESTPAYRYEAVCQLRRFLDEDDVLGTLANVAKTDKNVDVRKKAIYVLGKSKDPRAVELLKKIAER